MKKLYYLITLFLLTASPQAMRLISTSPAITESIFDLGKGNQLVGVSDYCQYPQEAQKITKIGSGIAPNYEAILRLKPDLIFLHGTRDKKVIEGLRQLNLRWQVLKFQTLRDVVESYKQLSVELQSPERGEDFVRRVKQGLDRLPHFIRGESYIVVIGSELAFGRPKTAHLAGEKTYYHDILNITGLKNAAKGPAPYPVWDREKIIQADPEKIFLIFHNRISRELVRKNLTAWKQLKEIKAVKNNKVHVLHGDFAVVAGPRIIQLIEKFQILLTP